MTAYVFANQTRPKTLVTNAVLTKCLGSVKKCLVEHPAAGNQPVVAQTQT